MKEKVINYLSCLVGNKELLDAKVIKIREFKKKDDLVEWIYHCPPDIGESYTITRVNKKKYILEVTQNNGQHQVS